MRNKSRRTREAMGNGAPANSERWGICIVGTAGICDGELDWSMDLADDAGNDRVRIRTIETLQNLSQASSIFQI